MKKRKKRYQFKRQFIKTIKRQSLEKMIALTKKDYLSECIYVEPLKEGDKLFIESDDMSDSFLNRSRANNEIVMPEAYINTALWLLDLIKLSNNNLVKDGYIFPALYCFRHYLELIMKDSIHYFKVNRGEISSNELGYSKNEHRLLCLWDSLKDYMQNDNIKESVYKLLEELDKLDKGSTTFRYPYKHNKKEEINEYDFPATMININELKKRMMQLYCFFEGINSMSRQS
jgi:hypothetical protein